jgi:hypothetical protein
MLQSNLPPQRRQLPPTPNLQQTTHQTIHSNDEQAIPSSQQLNSFTVTTTLPSKNLQGHFK